MTEVTELQDRQNTSLRRRLSPAFLLPVLPCLLFYRLFAGGCLLPANLLKDVYPWRTGNSADLVPWNVLQFDGITQFYPWRFFAAQTWKSGFVPLWNPHQFCGSPFLANGQSAALYPPNLIFLMMPVKYAFGWSDLLHLGFTGVAAYLFFRRAGGCGRWAAAIGAACWELSTWQISWLALPTFLDTSAWLPAALLGVHALAVKTNTARAAALGAILALMVLAGHLQILFYCLLLVTAYAVYVIVDRKVSFRCLLPAAALVVALVVLLSAAQIAPTLELSKQSARTGASATSAGYKAYAALAMPVEQLPSLFVPGFFGHEEQGTYWGATNYAENAGYIGAFGLMLSMIALFSKRKRAMSIFFAAVALFALLTAVGSPLDSLLYYGVPDFAATGSPARILVLWTFCTAFLTAFGADAVLEKQSGYWIGAGIYLLAAVAAVGAESALLIERSRSFLANLALSVNDIRLFVGLALAAFAVLWLLSRKTITREIAAPLIFCLVAVDLFAVNAGYNPVVSPDDVYPVTPSIAWLQRHAGFDRIMPVNNHWSITRPPLAVLPPNAATVYGLYDLQGYDSLQTKRYKQFANELDGKDSSPVQNGNMTFINGVGSSYAEAADAKYVISLTPLTGFGAPVLVDGATAVYIDPTALPLSGSATLTGLTATRATFEAARPFVASIQNYPGWRVAEPNGINQFGARDYEVRGGGAGADPFISISTPTTGVSSSLSIRVQLRYQPVSFLFGLYMTLVGLAVVFAVSSNRLLRNGTRFFGSAFTALV